MGKIEGGNKNIGEFCFAIFLLIFSVIMIYATYVMIGSVKLVSIVTTRTFPLVASFLLLIFSVIFLKNVAKKMIYNKKLDEIEIIDRKNLDKFKENMKLFIFIFIIFLYFIFVGLIGYKFSTSIFCVVIALFLGCREWYILLFLSLFPLIISYVFCDLLSVPLP